MDKYTVRLLEGAYKDIDAIYFYIANEKLAPENAAQQADRIKTAILGLEELPQAHQKRQTGRYADKNYRQLIVDHYLVIFRVEEGIRTVFVVTIQYAGRNV